MIKDNFYPSEPATTVGTEFTKFVPEIPITTEAAPNAYWLGWISVDNVPQALRPSEIVVNDTQYVFRDITPAANFDCGYNFSVPPVSTYYSSRDIGLSHYIASIEKWRDTRGSANDYNFCFGNKVDIMDSAISAVQFYEFYVIYDAGGNRVRTHGTIGNMHHFTFEEFISFLNGGSFISYYSDYGNITISKNDFVNGVVYKQTTTGHYAQVFLAGYRFTPTRTSSSDDSGNYPGVSAAFMVHIPTEKYGDSIISGLHTAQDPAALWDIRNPATVESLTVLRGLHGTFNIADVATLSPYDGGNFLLDGNVFLYSDFENQVKANAIYTIEDVEKHFNLCSRMSKARTTTDPVTPYYGYILNDVYAPYITDENEFTATRITGVLSDDEFKSKLRKWQYDETEWEKNDYTEDKKPEYIPPGDERENIGDKITRPASIGVGGTNGFVTQYALNRADVAQLGALLWTSFVDQDYWQNYLFSLALDTGTFQLSGLLNFFVSLKVYPFPLINIDSFSQWGSDMYIGTGIVPLHFNNPLHVINNYCDYISGGYIDIPRYFNDYRDYINTEISLYLPFCGTVQLNPGDVIGNRIDIQYAIDFATGGCIAYVDLTTGDGAGYPVGALPGQIGADIPLTATAAGEVAARFIGDGLNVAGMIGGEVGRIGSGVAGALGGNPSGGSGGGSVFAGVAGMYGGAGAAMAADLAPGLAKQGLQVLQRGAVGAPMLSGGRGFAAFGAPSKPYVQIRRGIYPELSGLHTVAGAPAAATTTISSLSGFIKGSVKADGLSCHQAEKEEIIALIASGIYV